jgi:hypothetical protein
MGWDGMGWDGMGWDGMGWDGGWDGMGWDGMGWDGMGWDMIDMNFVHVGQPYRALRGAHSKRPHHRDFERRTALGLMHKMKQIAVVTELEVNII